MSCCALGPARNTQSAVCFTESLPKDKAPRGLPFNKVPEGLEWFMLEPYGRVRGRGHNPGPVIEEGQLGVQS